MAEPMKEHRSSLYHQPPDFDSSSTEFLSGSGPTNKRNALNLSAMAITDEWYEKLTVPKLRQDG